MTTNLNAVAGPSKFPELVKSEPTSPEEYDFHPHLQSIEANSRGAPSNGTGSGSGGGDGERTGTGNDVSGKGGNFDENGEVIKVPAFLQKLYR